jgi:hypothetical protein
MSSSRKVRFQGLDGGVYGVGGVAVWLEGKSIKKALSQWERTLKTLKGFRVKTAYEAMITSLMGILTSVWAL